MKSGQICNSFPFKLELCLYMFYVTCKSKYTQSTYYLELH